MIIFFITSVLNVLRTIFVLFWSYDLVRSFSDLTVVVRYEQERSMLGNSRESKVTATTATIGVNFF